MREVDIELKQEGLHHFDILKTKYVITNETLMQNGGIIKFNSGDNEFWYRIKEKKFKSKGSVKWLKSIPSDLKVMEGVSIRKYVSESGYLLIGQYNGLNITDLCKKGSWQRQQIDYLHWMVREFKDMTKQEMTVIMQRIIDVVHNGKD